LIVLFRLHWVNSPRSDDGFTLIETLVTLSLVSVLSLLLIVGTSQIRSILTTTHRIDASVEVEALANYIAISLRNLRSLPIVSEAPTQRRPALIGTTDSITFVGISQIGAQDYSLREVNLLLQGPSQQGTFNLVQKSKSRRVKDKSAYLVTELADVETLRFEYRLKDGWLNEWNREELPLAIRVSLSINRKDQSVSTVRTVQYPWSK
jgi:prepilin-type N-terminal cleavage/methylation domain-containing protein